MCCQMEKFAAFLDLVYQDPVISQVKLIAEPWDANGGYVLGRFPHPGRSGTATIAEPSATIGGHRPASGVGHPAGRFG